MVWVWISGQKVVVGGMSQSEGKGREGEVRKKPDTRNRGEASTTGLPVP